MVLQTKTELKGPFFERDPGKTVLENITGFVGALTTYGEERARVAINARQAAMPGWTGRTRDRTIGRTTSETGRQWRTASVVGANAIGLDAKQAKRIMAAASTIEARWQPYRRTAYAMASKTRTVDLTKGLE